MEDKFCGEYECVFYDTDDAFCHYCTLNDVSVVKDKADHCDVNCDDCIFSLVCDYSEVHC